MYKNLDSSPDFSVFEKEIIKLWEKLSIVEKLKDIRSDRPKMVYYDGPITANNMPHYGHAITWTMKDIVPRYWSMKNYFVSRNMGWDCQGIPVEYEVEKELGFEDKSEIEKYGVAKFNDLCRKSVFKYRDQIFEYERRLGRWFDDTDMYYTMDATFIESMWWSLKELYKKGLLYEGHKVVAYSTRAGTPLSTHEVNEGGYKEVEDPSVTIKFELEDKPNTYFLAWTTTPWTLPGNLLLAVNKKIEYAEVEFNGESFILAKERISEVFKDKEYKIISDISSKDLIGKSYKPIFGHFQDKKKEGAFVVVDSSHATTEEGTGIVHLAPYGAEDFDILMAKGITLFDYLDDTAHFNNIVPEYEGLFYKKANHKIIEDLEAKKIMFKAETILHRVGLCWRTGTPLIYKPVKSWYIAVTKIKDQMLSQNQNINWLPTHIKEGQSKVWIQGARDWALSRSRYWGTPLPVWINDKTKEIVLIGSFEELEKLSGVKLEDPHRPFVDEVTWDDEKNGGTFRRIPDVVDVWYDSGSVPFAKLHYPFENKDKIDEMIPAQYISEGLDQVRLWFYTMHVLGVALFGKVPYENVVTTGMMLDKEGKKLSKSKRNFPPMDEVLDKFGADTLRLFILTSPIVQAESARFYEEALVDIKKEFFLPLWNSVKYFVTYATEHNYTYKRDLSSTHPMDQWILARSQKMINEVIENMDSYYFMDASRLLIPFVSDLSTWYIRRSRDRIREGDINALNTLATVLDDFVKVVAPMTPFISEYLYQALNLAETEKLDSVHLCLYPSAKKLTEAEDKILAGMQQDREIVTKVLSKRIEAKIAVRQPLESFTTKVPVTYEDIVKDEVNIKTIKVDANLNEDVELNINISEELKLEGIAREITRGIQALRKEQGLSISDKVSATYPSSVDFDAAVKLYGNEIQKTVGATELLPESKYAIIKKN